MWRVGFTYGRAQARGVQAQWSWPTGSAAMQHVESFHKESPLHWQADPYPLDQQVSPSSSYLTQPLTCEI